MFPVVWASLVDYIFSEVAHFSTKPLFLTHSDVWQFPIYSRDGYKCYLLFVGNYSCYSWIYPMKLKLNVRFTSLSPFESSWKICLIPKSNISKVIGAQNMTINLFVTILWIVEFIFENLPSTKQQTCVAQCKLMPIC